MVSIRKRRPVAQAIRADTRRSALIDAQLAGLIQRDGPGLALAVARAGVVVHAAGYGSANSRADPVGPRTMFHLASCGKQFTGLGILMLIEERKVKLDDPVGAHLPELEAFGPQVTLRRLLHHTSEIRDLYDDEGIEEVLARCQRPTNADIVRTYADLGCPMADDEAQPGNAFVYINSGYDLLGSVIEGVSGQTYHDFFQKRVFDPLQMRSTFSVPDRRVNDPRRATGYLVEDGRLIEHGGAVLDDVVGSGSFYSTVIDLCVYDGALATNALVAEASMREALTSGRTSDGAPTNYGFGWGLETCDGTRLCEHEGQWIGFRSYIARCLDFPLSIFVLSNHPDIDLIEIANEAIAIYR